MRPNESLPISGRRVVGATRLDPHQSGILRCTGTRHTGADNPGDPSATSTKADRSHGRARKSDPVRPTDGLGNPIPNYDASLAPQREKFVQSLLDKGFILSVESRGTGVTDAVVPPAFEGMPYDAKKSIAGALFAWGLDRNKSTFTVKFLSARTNKEVGSFSANGFEWQ